MKSPLPWLIALSVTCAVSPLTVKGQPKFETASVKRMDCGVIHNSLGPGTVVLRGDPLKVVLMQAFKVKPYQIAGPVWLDEDCFEIVAKMPEGCTSGELPAMLQALLVEWFRFASHREDRPSPVYALVVEKGGPKFQEANLNFRHGAPRPGTVVFRAAPDTQGFKGALTMARLAQFLSTRLGRPVQDFTGLTGIYDIDLAWAPDPSIDRPSASGISYSAAATALGDTSTDLPAAPTVMLFTALRESLGLKLEARSGRVEMLVIDHVERVPTEN
jgi:uncharacterized protein (TIGR03435 family)